MESNAWPFKCSRHPRGIENKYRIPDSSSVWLFCCEKEHRELSQEPQQRVSGNSRAEELSNRATLEIMIDKIRQRLRLLPYTYLRGRYGFHSLLLIINLCTWTLFPLWHSLWWFVKGTDCKWLCWLKWVSIIFRHWVSTASLTRRLDLGWTVPGC